MKISAVLHTSLMLFFQVYQYTSIPEIGKKKSERSILKSWKGNLNLPLEGRPLPNPSPLGEATQLMKKLDELAGNGKSLFLSLSFDNWQYLFGRFSLGLGITWHIAMDIVHRNSAFPSKYLSLDAPNYSAKEILDLVRPPPPLTAKNPKKFQSFSD